MSRKLPAGLELVVATHNPGKLTEIRALLAPHGISAVSAGSLGLPEPDETAPDFAGNARIKALASAIASGSPSLADDSGFCVAGLGGAPGVVSARWAGPDKDFTAAMERVQHELAQAGTSDGRAWFISVLCLAWPDGHTDSFMGRVDGTTIWPPRGTLGFGYDPMFLPGGAAYTYGEMTPEAKERDSHRSRAFRQFARAVLQA